MAEDPLLPHLWSIKSALEDLPTKEVDLQQLVDHCIQSFKSNPIYQSDIRFLKIWLIYIDLSPEYEAAFRELEECEICLDKSLLYESYALLLESKGMMREAHLVYQLGISRNGEPIGRLKEAHVCFLERMQAIVDACSLPKNKIVAKKAKKDVEKNDADRNAKKLEGRKDVDRYAKEAEGRKDENNITKKRMEKEKEMGKKRQREPGKDDAINEKKKKKTTGNEKKTTPRKMTRAQRKTRVRLENSKTLKLVAMMVDAQVSKVRSMKVQCEDSLYGHMSFTYLNFDDFDRVFAMDEMSSAVVTSYSMYLFEQIKNGPTRDHGICFMNPTATMQSDVKSKVKNVEDSSRRIAERLSSRKGNDIVLLPYNPGRHWVLGVLNMKTATCYYLDSLRTSSVNLQFKQIVDAAIALYEVQSGFKNKSKLNWVKSKCPMQPGNTECGYYVLKFMQEIVEQGIQVLEYDNIGEGKEEYTDDDLDEVREEWANYVAKLNFPVLNTI